MKTVHCKHEHYGNGGLRLCQGDVSTSPREEGGAEICSNIQ